MRCDELPGDKRDTPSWVAAAVGESAWACGLGSIGWSVLVLFARWALSLFAGTSDDFVDGDYDWLD